MVIVCQDKSVIVNFKNIKSIFYDSDDTKKVIFAMLSDRCNITLGKYKSEKRVLEIMDNIVDYISLDVNFLMPEK